MDFTISAILYGSGITIILYAIYLIVQAISFIRYKPKPITKKYQPFVSVIIPVRNEEKNIQSCLLSVASQTYPAHLYEILLVNDSSEDQTVAIAQSLGIANLRILSADGNTKYAYKKAAITQAISESKGEIILTTDGDCIVPVDWIAGMISQFSEKTAMVAGPVKLTGSNLIQQMQSLEFCGLQIVGAGSIARNSPTMANGASLAYRKSDFLAVDGFRNVDQIASGDDELLMHKLFAAGLEVRFAALPEVIVETKACENWNSFRNQRIRWVSKSTVYQNQWITLTLMNAYLANLSFLILLVLILIKPSVWHCLPGLFCIKWLGELTVLIPATRFFGNQALLKWFIPEQILHIFYVIWVGIAGNITKTYSWKGREVQ